MYNSYVSCTLIRNDGYFKKTPNTCVGGTGHKLLDNREYLMHKIIQGDSLEVLKTMEDNSVDSIVTDPPYGISFMGKKWDYDVPQVELWKEVLRVLKPGGHALVACGTRTQHRMAVNLEDAGFEIRDIVAWVYGSGFPKSRNITLDMDKMEGHGNRGHRIAVASRHHPDGTLEPNGEILPAYEPKSDNAKKWNGWGTALKPAMELWTLCRKPLEEKTVAENVLKYGTGGINIDGCRVKVNDEDKEKYLKSDHSQSNSNPTVPIVPSNYKRGGGSTQGRFPANFIHDGSDEVVELFPNDSQRFFYCAKASKSERNKGCEDLENKVLVGQGLAGENNNPSHKNNHPTVKPIALMKYLCRIITPKDGTVLDPFTGSGSTGIGAKLEGFNFIGIEREEEYVKIAEARINAYD